MILVIDAGNSRVKWGWWEAGAWRAKGAADWTAWPEAELGAWRPDWIGVCCVAGEAERNALSERLAVYDVAVYWPVAAADFFGVANRYRQPERLGVDRLAILLACWRRHWAPCVVASLGTAVTVDALSSAGEFLGGVILPGAVLTRRALSSGTAGVNRVLGEVSDFPCDTGDGVESGFTLAVAGAVEGMRGRLVRREGKPVASVLTGGDAARLAPWLPSSHGVAEDLVLEGMLWVAWARGVPVDLS